MKVLILTSGRKGTAGHHLPRLLESGCCEVVMVVYNQGRIARRWRHYWRKLRKVARIGPLGALNGLRMRSWFSVDEALQVRDIGAICAEHGIPFRETPAINTDATAQLFRDSGAELGLSLGNSYIAPRIFSIPRLGMVNLHHELLPAYQNAQSIIWQLNNGSATTGFTLHAIDRHIDTGSILYQQEVPIRFGNSLRETVSGTMARLMTASAEGLVHCLQHYPALAAAARPQGKGISYTTPTFRQFIRIERNWKKLARAAGIEGAK
jgi:methionyl-tRNA formyltransferase